MSRSIKGTAIFSALLAFVLLMVAGCSQDRAAQPPSSPQDALSMEQEPTESASSKNESLGQVQADEASASESANANDKEKASLGQEGASGQTSANKGLSKETSKNASKNPTADANKKTRKKSTADGKASSSSSKKRTWVEPVYKTVHHKEQGHYESQTVQVQKVRCNCGTVFDTAASWKAHQDAFIQHMRDTVDPNYVCKGDHLSHYVTVDEIKQVYVVDREAYDEKVLVKEGYWK